MSKLRLAVRNTWNWIQARFQNVSITDVLVAACTVLLTYTAVIQIDKLIEANQIATVAVDQTKRSVDSASDTARKQLRAYLSVVKGEVSGLEDDDPLRVKLTFRNSGQTPAYEVVGDAKIGVTDYPLKQSPDVDTVPDGPPMMLGTGLESYVFWDGDSADKPKINSGEKVIHAFGSFRYKDVFGEQHKLKFSLIYHGDPGFKFSPLMGPTREGNEAD